MSDGQDIIRAQGLPPRMTITIVSECAETARLADHRFSSLGRPPSLIALRRQRDWLGGAVSASPGVASWSAGRLDVFARSYDGTLGHLWYASSWSAWEFWQTP